LTGEVSGPYLANILTQKLGYGVSANEPYYLPGCTSSAQCVFPNAVVPQRAWADPSMHLLPYIPLPNAGDATFSSGAYGTILRDDKGSVRFDASAGRWGLISGHYFFDDYNLNNPYPTGQGGASVPGFAALNLGRSQLANVGETKTFGTSLVNKLRLSYVRSANNVGQPSGGVGPSLASQGFVTGPGTVQFRLETFNTFNHPQFFGPAAVNGDFGTGTFGYAVKTAPPRLVQVALKFMF